MSVQPPFHITGIPSIDWIIFIAGWVVCLYWLRALRLTREAARLFLLNFLKTIMVFSTVMAILTASRLQTHLVSSQELLIAGLLALIFFGNFQGKRRSRSIPKAIRRAVIERDLKGEHFDPRIHHIDHIWPFSKGGSHTIDNLRVIERTKNLRKGATRPRMREMWR
jgi:hypothetical protein